MSSNDTNTVIYNSIIDKIDQIKEDCKISLATIANNPSDLDITATSEHAKTLCYVDGMRADIERSEPTLSSDVNLTTLEYVIKLRDRVTQLEHLVAYKRGLLMEINANTAGLKSLIDSYEKAKSQTANVNIVTDEHIEKAKAHFRLMKNNCKKLVNALFENSADDVMAMLGDLIQKKNDETSDGYMELEPEQFHIAEMLKDANLITTSPYNKDQIKICLD